MKVVHGNQLIADLAAAPACTILVAGLPALEDVKLSLPAWELGSLLEALAGRPRLRALDLRIEDEYEYPADAWSYPDSCFEANGALKGSDVPKRFTDAPAFAKLHSLTKLALSLNKETVDCEVYSHVVSDIVTALVPLTGLAELALWWQGEAVVPAALAQLTGLRSLELSHLVSTVLEAGGLNLPNLVSLDFQWCHFQ